MPCLSNVEDSTNSYYTNCCDASSAIFQSLYGHYAYALIKWLQVYCSRPLFLDHYPEWTQLKRESAKAIGLWILHDIIYGWACLLWIVTDTSPADNADSLLERCSVLI